jgi:hypothetical protein
MHEDNLNLIDLEHIPVQPPRPGTPGEAIYLELWREYLAANPNRLGHILRDVCGEPTQRDATVCASFMVFMGCNGGRSLHQHAENLVSGGFGIMRAEAYRFAWAKMNSRRSGVNNGIRTIEFMLAEHHPIKDGHVHHELIPDLTMRDIDVVEAMVDWWGGIEAHEIRSIAEPMIEVENRRALSTLFHPKVEG